MSYPPQQPWGGQAPQGQPSPFGAPQPQSHQRWGGQQPQPQWSSQQSQPQWGGQHPQSQWGGPQSGQFGQPQHGQQFQGQQFGGAGSGGGGRKNLPWLIGIGVGAVVLVVLVIILVMTLSGGGKYAGDTKPALPDSFGDWTRGEDMFGLVAYSNGSDEVTVIESGPVPEDQRLEPDDIPTLEGYEPPDDFEESSPGAGITCAYSPSMSTASCVIAYEDGSAFLIGGSDQDAVEDAAVALADA